MRHCKLCDQKIRIDHDGTAWCECSMLHNPAPYVPTGWGIGWSVTLDELRAWQKEAINEGKSL